ncbi:MAG: hypothetical protein JSS27_00680 [Planctomycetes bacterium]|nr:hypothetical protein [Planctomycetota bacterium]
MTLPENPDGAHDSLGRLPESVLSRAGHRSQVDFDIAFYGAILERSPSYLDVLRCLGELLARKGLHQRALEIDRRLVILAPNDPVVHYNLTCSLSLNGQVDEALKHLGRALDLGYDNLEHLQADTDLDPLREHPGFAALLAPYLAEAGEE